MQTELPLGFSIFFLFIVNRFHFWNATGTDFYGKGTCNSNYTFTFNLFLSINKRETVLVPFYLSKAFELWLFPFPPLWCFPFLEFHSLGCPSRCTLSTFYCHDTDCNLNMNKFWENNFPKTVRSFFLPVLRVAAERILSTELEPSQQRSLFITDSDSLHITEFPIG